MAIKILLSFPGVGDLKGSSTFTGHKDKIEVDNFQYGVSVASQNGIAQGERNHSEVTLTKHGDEVSAVIAMFCAQGTKVKSAVVEFLRKDRAGVEAIYQTYTLTDCVISSYAVQGSAGSDDTWTESFALNFGAISAKIVGKDYNDDTRINVGDVKLGEKAHAYPNSRNVS